MGMDLPVQRLLFRYLRAPEKPWNPWRFLSEVGGGEESQQSGLLGRCRMNMMLFHNCCLYQLSWVAWSSPAHLPHRLPRQDGAQRHEAVHPIMRGPCQAAAMTQAHRVPSPSP